MTRLLRPALALAVVAGGALAQSPATAPVVDLDVLYVGAVDSPRTADFVAFLGAHFARVGTAAYPTFTAEQADPYDVVVIDSEMHPTERSIGIGPRPELPHDYARATVLVNGPGVILGQRLGSKIDWW